MHTRVKRDGGMGGKTVAVPGTPGALQIIPTCLVLHSLDLCRGGNWQRVVAGRYCWPLTSCPRYGVKHPQEPAQPSHVCKPERPLPFLSPEQMVPRSLSSASQEAL